MRRYRVYYEKLECMDSLSTISPVQDMAQISLVAGKRDSSKVTYSMDFLVGSGNEVKSYLTFACSRIPMDEGPIALLPQGQKNLVATKVLTCSE